VQAKLSRHRFIYLDPRWVKKLAARGATDEVAAYVDHVLDQAEYVLRSQDVKMLTTTPPLLAAMARSNRLVELINLKVLRLQIGSAHLDEDTRMRSRTSFPCLVEQHRWQHNDPGCCAHPTERCLWSNQ
jgi:hypothetical protein